MHARDRSARSSYLRGRACPHAVLGRYHDLVLAVENRYDGHVGSTKGDGWLAGGPGRRATEDPATHRSGIGTRVASGAAAVSARAARLGGSTATGMGTATSDLDITVLLDVFDVTAPSCSISGRAGR